jgi:hypothetical protein
MEKVIKRFDSKINKIPNGCWMWLGTTTGLFRGTEYGTFWTGEDIVLAHRFSLGRRLGRKILKGLKALHKCDVSMCVNPDHLYEGTQGQNNKDAYQRGRRSGAVQSKMLLAARKKKLGY